MSVQDICLRAFSFLFCLLQCLRTESSYLISHSSSGFEFCDAKFDSYHQYRCFRYASNFGFGNEYLDFFPPHFHGFIIGSLPGLTKKATSMGILSGCEYTHFQKKEIRINRLDLLFSPVWKRLRGKYWLKNSKLLNMCYKKQPTNIVLFSQSFYRAIWLLKRAVFFDVTTFFLLCTRQKYLISQINTI